MTTGATGVPTRQRRRRKRWVAAGLLWLLLTYPASLGPACYGFGRGWLPASSNATLEAVYAPLDNPVGHWLLDGYADWFFDLGARHGR